MAQFARPDSDVTVSDWTTAPLWSKIDEAIASDADLISSNNNTNLACEVGLSNVTDPALSTGHIVRYRYRKSAAAGNARNITVGLYQGTTLVAEQTHTGITETFTAGTFTLTGTQADAITDYTDLRLRFAAGGTTGGSGAARRTVDVSWAELEVPDLQLPQQIGIARFTMQNPPRNLLTGAGLQEIRVRAGRTGTGANPTLKAEILVAGSSTVLATPINDVAISALGVVSGTFDASVLPDISGANLELRITGTGSADGGTAIDPTTLRAEWNAVLVEQPPAQEITAAGAVATAEAFSSPTVNQVIAAVTSIASTEAFEAPTLEAGAAPPQEITAVTAIGSAEAFESPVLETYVVIDVPSIETRYGSGELVPTIELAPTSELVPTGGLVDEAFESPTVEPQAFTFDVTGIASLEAISVPIVEPQVFTFDVTEIASLEAVSVPTVEAAALTFIPGEIASAESFGSPALEPGAVEVTATGEIASSEDFEDPAVLAAALVFPDEVESVEAFESPQVEAGAVEVLPATLPSAEAFDDPSVYMVVYEPLAIASQETFGSPAIDLTIAHTAGVPSAEAFGTATIAPALHPLEIASAEVVEAPSLETSVELVATSVQSGELFGSPILGAAAQVEVEEIASTEALDSPNIEPQEVYVVDAGAIESSESFENPFLEPGVVEVGVVSIEPAETILAPEILVGANDLFPSSVGSAEAFDAPTLEVGPVEITPAEIGSAEALGAPTLEVGAFYADVAGISSTEAFGVASVEPGAATFIPGEIASTESFAIATVAPGAVELSEAGEIVSAEAFGTPELIAAAQLLPGSIGSAQVFGGAALEPGPVELASPSLASAEAFGAPVFGRSISITEVPSAEVFGEPSLDTRVNVQSIASSESIPSALIRTIVWADPATIGSREAFGEPDLHLRFGIELEIVSIGSGEAVAVPVLAIGGKEITGDVRALVIVRGEVRTRQLVTGGTR